MFNRRKFVSVTPTIKLELLTDMQMQLLIDEFGGKESDFTKKLVTECDKKARKGVLAKAKEEKKNAKKLPDVLKPDEPGNEPEPNKQPDPNKEPKKQDPPKKELSSEYLIK